MPNEAEREAGEMILVDGIGYRRRFPALDVIQFFGKSKDWDHMCWRRRLKTDERNAFKNN